MCSLPPQYYITSSVATPQHCCPLTPSPHPNTTSHHYHNHHTVIMMKMPQDLPIILSKLPWLIYHIWACHKYGSSCMYHIMTSVGSRGNYRNKHCLLLLSVTATVDDWLNKQSKIIMLHLYSGCGITSCHMVR